MKKLLCMSLIAAVVTLSACNETPANLEESRTEPSEESRNETSLKEAEYVVGLPSYMGFENVQALTDMASDVIIGEPTNISFKVFDAETGLPPTEKTDSSSRWLATVYDINVSETFMGEVRGSIQIIMGGGLKNYRVEEQLKVMEEFGSHTPPGVIPLIEGVPKLDIGEKYLFTLRKSSTGLFSPMIPQQSVYELDNPFRKHSLSEGANDDYSYDSKNGPGGGNALISAYDIISTFGEDKRESFWGDWQRDNPDWESRIDRAEVERVLGE